MAYDQQLANRVKSYLEAMPGLEIIEKKMFKGVTYMVNGKMCVNISGDNLMCRFDPALYTMISAKKGFQPLYMKGKLYQGYCYVGPEGFSKEKDFQWWIQRCLDYNKIAKASKKSG
jgi:TfoX N-terminal domain